MAADTRAEQDALMEAMDMMLVSGEDVPDLQSQFMMAAWRLVVKACDARDFKWQSQNLLPGAVASDGAA